MKQIALGYVVILISLSVATFFLYGFDKHQARRDGRRIPEKTLQRFALLGGWPGALLGQRFFRHKTKKNSFQIVFWLLVSLHLISVAAIFILTRQFG